MNYISQSAIQLLNVAAASSRLYWTNWTGQTCT